MESWNSADLLRGLGGDRAKRKRMHSESLAFAIASLAQSLPELVLGGRRVCHLCALCPVCRPAHALGKWSLMLHSNTFFPTLTHVVCSFVLQVANKMWCHCLANWDVHPATVFQTRRIVLCIKATLPKGPLRGTHMTRCTISLTFDHLPWHKPRPIFQECRW